MSQHPSAREERFRRLYAEHFDALLGYALRRVDRPEDAADVVADAFLVAWRRLDDVPAGTDATLWLYGVARRTLANHRRGEGRRSALGERLRRDLGTHVPDPSYAVVERRTVADALARLADRDREVLQLAAWEGLEPREIAAVIGVSAVAVRTRLSRSRARLRAMLGNDRQGKDRQGNDPGGSGQVPDKRTSLVPEEGR